MAWRAHLQHSVPYPHCCDVHRCDQGAHRPKTSSGAGRDACRKDDSGPQRSHIRCHSQSVNRVIPCGERGERDWAGLRTGNDAGYLPHQKRKNYDHQCNCHGAKGRSQRGSAAPEQVHARDGDNTYEDEGTAEGIVKIL